MSDTETTRDQRRVRNALEKVQEIAKQDYRHYPSYVKSLPASILQNGLGQALASLLAAAKGDSQDPHRFVYDHLNQWLCDDDQRIYPDSNDILEAIVSCDQRKYVLAQAEAMAYLRWLKKFSAAFLKAPKKGA